MTVNVPQENPNLPDNLKRLIEKTQNNLSVQEAEIKRLKGLVREMNVEVEGLNVAKVAVQEEINELETRKKELAETVAHTVNDLSQKREEMKGIDEAKSKLDEEIRSLQDDRREFLDDSTEIKAEQDKREDDLNRREKEIEKREKEVESKAKKIEKLISSIS